MTSAEVTSLYLPYVRKALQTTGRDRVKEAAGLGWVAVWPAWAVFTGPLLNLVVRIGVEIAIGLVGAPIVPVLELIAAFLPYISREVVPDASRKFVADFLAVMKSPRSEFLPEVRMALGDSPPLMRDGGGAGDDSLISDSRNQTTPEGWDMGQAYHKMHAAITNDVIDKIDLTTKSETEPGKMGFSADFSSVVVSAIPGLVSVTLDFVTTVGGSAVAALVAEGKPEIRAFVSEKVLEYVQGLVVSLEDVKAVG